MSHLLNLDRDVDIFGGIIAWPGAYLSSDIPLESETWLRGNQSSHDAASVFNCLLTPLIKRAKGFLYWETMITGSRANSQGRLDHGALNEEGIIREKLREGGDFCGTAKAVEQMRAYLIDLSRGKQAELIFTKNLT